MTLRAPRQAVVDLNYRLHDAITKADGRVFASGTQALVRMLVMQRLADRRDGAPRRRWRSMTSGFSRR